MPPLAVFDTNVLVSGVVWRGSPFQCLELARSGAVRGLTCQELLDELTRILREKLDFSEEIIAAALAHLLSFLELVTIDGALRVIAADPDDDKVLECAIVSGAQYIVTGDRRHLLPIGIFQGIRIVSVSEFIRLVSPAGRGA